MGTSSFAAGTHITINGQEFQLLRMFADGADKAHPKWQIEEVRTKRIIEHSVQELQSLYSSGALVFPRGRAGVGQAHREIDPEQLEVAKVRLAYVKAVLKLPASHALIRDTIKEIWEKIQKPELPPGTSSVLRWKRLYTKAGNDILALVERTGDMGNRAPRLPPQLLDFVKEAVEQVYLTPEKNQITEVVDRVRADVNEWNALALPELKLPLPTRRTVRRIIDSIPAFDRYAARHGRVAAVKRFRAVRAHRTTAAPLERAEIDHTQLDLMVIDDRTGLPLGRPYVTACIDDYTRCVLGIEIGFEPPGFLTVARCLKTAFMPKELTNLYPRVKNTWEAHGVMRELVVDNGAEFHSVSLENACYRLGIEIHYSARKTPWFKGKIERFLQTLNGAIAHGRPGTTFGNIFEKEEYDPSKHAVIRLSTLKEIAHIWIVDVYHQMPHRTLMDSPAAVWASSVALENILLPDDPAEMDAILGRSEHRKLTHRGIELDGLLYNSDDLTNLRMRLQCSRIRPMNP